MKNVLSTVAFIAFALFAYSSVFAQAAPSAQQMIEQLKTQPVPDTPRRTRSLRNLSVEAVDQAADATPPAPVVKPSLSLQIQFEFNSAQISPVSQQALLNLSSALKAAELSASKFEVEGHTDAKGNDAYNLKLSQQRAEAVQQFLVHHGIAINRLVASGKGSTQLANAANPLAAENRRVRIVNLD
jgi:outer membrane protein OmpA-like peptidoglycan-associated protein